MIGGDYFQFFSAIFNVADASIFIGVCIILIFQKRFFPEKQNEEDEPYLHTEKVVVNEKTLETEE